MTYLIAARIHGVVEFHSTALPGAFLAIRICYRLADDFCGMSHAAEDAT
jgi:hypothetical protein